MSESITCKTLFGFDATIRVEFNVTHWGSPAVIDYVWGGKPAEGPEYEIDEIGVTLDLDDGEGAEWIVDWKSREFRVLAALAEQDIIDAIGREKSYGRRKGRLHSSLL